MKQFNIELGLALRQFIEEPDNFLRSIVLVNSFYTYSVLASTKPYAISFDGQKLTPVFTKKEDLEVFCREHPIAIHQDWEERSTLDVLKEVIMNGLTGLVFNVKKSGDFSNSTIFKSRELVQFINTYTDILNDLTSEENIEADWLDKFYLVPVFISLHKNGRHRCRFPVMINEKNQKCVPVFSDLSSFAKWYNHPEFGLPFREKEGMVFVWKLKDIRQGGRHEMNNTLGVVVNPLAGQQEMIMKWDEIDC